MKTLLLFLLCCTGLHAQDNKLLASCCDVTPAKTFGRCSGDASCTACSNCRYCKHCSKEGGSCGVCAPAPTPAKKAAATRQAGKGAKSPTAYLANQMLEVKSQTLNLRDGPGGQYHIIEELAYGDMVTFVRYEGEWVFVRVDASGNTGWVNYQFIK
ncbi:SH3 domain-containing protein [Flavobacterium psychrotrophum]|uniref:SH3 domain-containing protein n=1 Tax=Flavobacterium psychrotrophum TaxID=2294119 RepID=UPI0013C43F1B|nr:SH3 domain-containing protein [Flavobacterium psychrotrophum]